MSVHINSFASFDVTEYMNTLITVCFVYTLYNYNYIYIYRNTRAGAEGAQQKMVRNLEE